MSTQPPSPPNPATEPDEPAPEAAPQGAVEGAGEILGAAEDAALHLTEKVGEELRQLAHTRTLAELFSSAETPFIRGLALWLAATALGGTLIALTQGLSDWYMHAAMYLVVIAYLALYAQSHKAARRMPRALSGLATVGLAIFFAWILHDLVRPRSVVLGGELVDREAIPLLRVPSAMLAATALGVVAHWLLLARHRVREEAT